MTEYCTNCQEVQEIELERASDADRWYCVECGELLDTVWDDDDPLACDYD